jgi:hypothetical protein
MQPEIHATEPPVPASDLLPPPRRKGIPRVTAILGVGLLAAATFLAGIEAQKQWGGSSTASARGNGFAARFAAGGAAGAGAGAGTGTAGANGAGGAQGAGGFAGRAGGGFTTGTVKLVKGTALYITTTDGNTVKVTVPAATAVTKTVTAKLASLKPGENVTAIGQAGSDGVITAQRVTVGAAGFGGGFGGFGRRANGGANGGTQGGNGTTTQGG